MRRIKNKLWQRLLVILQCSFPLCSSVVVEAQFIAGHMTFADKGLRGHSYGFSRIEVWMRETVEKAGH